MRGYDVRTGKELWEFHTCPREGEVGYNTWELKDSEKNRTGNNVWAFALTVDEKNGLVFLPTGNATPDYVMSHRTPEMNKYASSTIALDAETGTLVWEFTRAGTFDFACLEPGHFEAGMKGKLGVK